MEPGKGRSRAWLWGPVLVVASGCAAGRPQLEQALLADRNPAAHGGAAALHYHVHCPDVLSVAVGGPGAWSGSRRVGADGRIALGDENRLRIDGMTTPEVAAAIAAAAGVSADQVEVRVAEHNSQQVFLFGEITGPQRALPYRGPETVLDLLQRAGGITPGAEVGDVQVVRAHVAEGSTPEVFHIDLAAIVLKKDPHTNVRLEPFDQVYVGQSPRSRLIPCFPPWMRPTYEALCGLRRPGAKPATPPAAPPAE